MLKIEYPELTGYKTKEDAEIAYHKAMHQFAMDMENGLKLNFSNIRKRHVNNHQMMREIMENCILKIILLSLTSQLPCSHFK